MIEYLERCRYPGQHQSRIAAVRARVARLRTFANHKPGQVAHACDGKADELEQQLNRIIGSG